MKLTKEELKEFDSLTEFQQDVLRACAAIPKGEVRTYSEIAKAIGRPKASRAVGSALAMNPFAPKIPCHRVVKKDGSLGNYSGKGGVASKKRLLKEEKAI